MTLQAQPRSRTSAHIHPTDDVEALGAGGPQLLHRHRLGVAGFYSNYCPSQDLAAKQPSILSVPALHYNLTGDTSTCSVFFLVS